MKHDQYLEKYQFATSFHCGLSIILILSLCVTEVVVPPEKRVQTFVAGVLFILPLIGLCLIMLARLRRKKYTERQLTAIETQETLKLKWSNYTSGIQLPLSFQQHSRYLSVLVNITCMMIMFIVLWLASLLIFLDAYLGQSAISLVRNNTFVGYITIILAVPVILGVAWIITQEFDQQIIVSEEGLMVTRGGSKQFIPFDASMLFAKFEWPYIQFHRSNYCEYELSNQTSVVRFVRVLKEGNLWLNPTVPFGEYDQQMESLVRYIEARTGLQVYNVS